MIVSSLLILVIAAVLLVTGMITGNDALLGSSIAASLAAGIALYAGIRSRGAKRPRIARQRRADRGAQDDDTQQFKRIVIDDTPTTELPLLEGKVFESTDYAVDRDPELRFEDGPQRSSGTHRAPESLADEPAPQRLTAVDAAALMRLDTEVAVVDGRPRFHDASCARLSGRDHEPLPVAEALELGFSPCGLCEPVSRLLMAPVAGR